MRRTKAPFFCSTNAWSFFRQDRYIIRYDNRDTGLSTFYQPGSPPYTKDDLAEDAIRVLDAYGLANAHLVGMSMGAEIAQIAALAHPDRVKTLTLISTSPVGIDTSFLPQTTDAYMEHAADGGKVDWSDVSQAVDYRTLGWLPVMRIRMTSGVHATWSKGMQDGQGTS
jgi:pimeloyl-ACP methyl ester carboxylesterase